LLSPKHILRPWRHDEADRMDGVIMADPNAAVDHKVPKVTKSFRSVPPLDASFWKNPKCKRCSESLTRPSRE
jgi:hypothetical protein